MAANPPPITLNTIIPVNGNLIALQLPDLTNRGFGNGPASLVLTQGWQHKRLAYKGSGKKHIEYRHGNDLAKINATTAEDYVGKLINTPYRIYDTAYKDRLLIHRSFKPVGGLIIGKVEGVDYLQISAALNLANIPVGGDIFIVISAFGKKNPEGEQLWVQRK